jgi:hypothetical protein
LQIEGNFFHFSHLNLQKLTIVLGLCRVQAFKLREFERQKPVLAGEREMESDEKKRQNITCTNGC